MVTIKFNPVRMDERPTMKMPTTVGTTRVVKLEVLKGV
jgi:hypothetical protein